MLQYSGLQVDISGVYSLFRSSDGGLIHGALDGKAVNGRQATGTDSYTGRMVAAHLDAGGAAHVAEF